MCLRDVGFVYTPGTPWARRGLQAVSLEIREGEGVLVSGDNGSGKTTLAWVLAGLLAPTEGEAFLDGRPLYSCVGEVGMTFQHVRLQLFRPTVASDVAFGTDLDDDDVAELLEEVGLDVETMLSRRIDELSGGEQRRVALAGLLARRPRLVVLDEPLAGLDSSAKEVLVAGLERLRASHGVTTIVVAHDLELGRRLAERQIRLDGGTVVEDAPIEAVLTGVTLDHPERRRQGS